MLRSIKLKVLNFQVISIIVVHDSYIHTYIHSIQCLTQCNLLFMSLEGYTFVFSFFSNRPTGPFRVQGGNNDFVGICEGQ